MPNNSTNKPDTPLDAAREKAAARNALKEQAASVLAKGEPKNRGHAFLILKDAGLDNLGPHLYNEVIAAYELKTEVTLGNSRKRTMDIAKAEAKKISHQMEHSDVTEHVSKMDKKPDTLFYECWDLYKNGKWDGELEAALFTDKFKPAKLDHSLFRDGQIESVLSTLSSEKDGAGPAHFTDAFNLVESTNPDMPTNSIKQLVYEWQRQTGMVLPRSPENQATHDMRVISHKMSSDGVKMYIATLVDSDMKADPLFWQCHDLFKQGKWESELSTSDFSPLFEKKNQQARGASQLHNHNSLKQASAGFEM